MKGKRKRKKKWTLPTLHCFHVGSQLTDARLPVMFPALSSAPLLFSNCVRFPSSFSFLCQLPVTSRLYPCSHVPPVRPSSLLHRLPFTNSAVVITAYFPFPSFHPFLSNTPPLIFRLQLTVAHNLPLDCPLRHFTAFLFSNSQLKGVRGNLRTLFPF